MNLRTLLYLPTIYSFYIDFKTLKYMHKLTPCNSHTAIFLYYYIVFSVTAQCEDLLYFFYELFQIFETIWK